VNHQSYDEQTHDGHWRPVGEKWYDIWGTGWVRDRLDVMGFPVENPLAMPDALEGYVWPDPNDPRICNKIYEQAEAVRKVGGDVNFFLSGSHRDTLWEKAYMLVGMENMMCYFYEEPEYAAEILHRIMDFQLGIAQHYCNVGVEMVNLGDDMGAQCSLLFSKKIFDRFFYPEYKRLFDFYKSKGVMINFHSCGHIEPLLDTFIELGVDILNPVQATANDLKKVFEKTHGKMALCGAISTGLLMDGTPEMIRRTVRETIELLGSDGGYFCTPDQYMPIPPENLAVLRETVYEFKYKS
jgi:uroporphyrinogen decarboxylase